MNIHRQGTYKTVTQIKEFSNCWLRDIINEKWTVSLTSVSDYLAIPYTLNMEKTWKNV